MIMDKKKIREYRAWKAMKARCQAPSYKNKGCYQKKGIKVCERWNSYENFIEDMGRCPDGYSLDRIDNNGDYCPENCRWASWEEQAKNRGKFNKIFTYKGKTQCLKDWAKELKIKYVTLCMRIKRNPKASFEEIISFVDPRAEKIMWENALYTREELCNKYNIPLKNFYDRTHKGWPLEKILLTPINHKI